MADAPPPPPPPPAPAAEAVPSTAELLLRMTAMLSTLQAAMVRDEAARTTPAEAPPAPPNAQPPPPPPQQTTTPARTSKVNPDTDDTTPEAPKTPAGLRHDADHKAPRRSPRFQFKGKKPFTGALDDNVGIFIHSFETQTKLANITDDDALLLLPTCLEDRALRWFHEERLSNGPFQSYIALRNALIAQFTPTHAEKMARQAEVRTQRQNVGESVLQFNIRFETLVSNCQMSDDEARDAYIEALRPPLRDALTIRFPATLRAAMRDAMTLSLTFAKRKDEAQTPYAQPQVNQVANVGRRPNNRQKPYSRAPCGKCGGNHRTERCGVKCPNCGRLGHTESECRQTRRIPNAGPCSFCKGRHNTDQCWKDPNGPSYRPPKKGAQKGN